MSSIDPAEVPAFMGYLNDYRVSQKFARYFHILMVSACQYTIGQSNASAMRVLLIESRSRDNNVLCNAHASFS